LQTGSSYAIIEILTYLQAVCR